MSKKILVVDDEEDLVRLIQKRLETEGFEVLIAFDGLKAIEIAHHQLPDLIILDIMMPVGDGYSVCQRLKGHSATRYIPIIFLTAKAEEEDEIKGYKLGAACYLKKPYEPHILMETVRKALSSPQELASEGRKKIKNLLVFSEDDILKKILQSNFSDLWELLFVHNEKEFTSFTELNSLDAILLDLNLGGIDYVDMLLRLENSFKKSLLIVLIGDGSIQDLAEEIRAKIKFKTELLRRPFTIDELKLVLK